MGQAVADAVRVRRDEGEPSADPVADLERRDEADDAAVGDAEADSAALPVPLLVLVGVADAVGVHVVELLLVSDCACRATHTSKNTRGRIAILRL